MFVYKLNLMQNAEISSPTIGATSKSIEIHPAYYNYYSPIDVKCLEYYFVS